MTSRLEGDPLDHVWRSSAGGSPLLTLDIGPLRDDEAGALAHAYVDASAELARRCVARAAGNPLFLDQLLRHAEESAEEGVPASVQSLVQARLDHLSPADRQALQAASALGQRFTADALGHLLGQPTHDCADLVRHLLVRSIGDELLFAHALIRDGVYDSLLRSRRAALHLRAAAWFATRDAGLHAEHLDRAEDPGAPDAYLEAARGQLATYRYDAALGLAERGLAIARIGQQTFALTCLRGEILHDLGSMAEAGAAYGAALEAAGDDAQRCRAWLGLAAVKRVTDDLDGAFADLERAQAAAQVQNLEEQLAHIHFLRGNLHFPRGNLEGCLEEHRKSLACATAVGAADLEAAALGGLGDAEYARGRMVSAHDRFRACVELCRRHGFGRIEVANASMLGHTGLYFQPQSDALAVALAAADGAARVGHRRAELNARLAAFFALYELAELEQVGEQVERASALARALGAARFDQACLLYLGKVALAQDRRADAIELMSQALTVARDTSVGFHGPNICGALALVLEDPAQRREMLREGEAMLVRGSVAHNHLRFYPDAMATALELRDRGAFERYAAALEGFTRAEPLPWADFFIAQGRALAAFDAGQRDGPRMEELERLRAEAARLGLKSALVRIDDALLA
jgi:tetratricopeptide (TPR) repeat protein